ncbi:MAG: hypothetical protein ACR2F6_12260 [Mycobacteriales bacterium]
MVVGAQAVYFHTGAAPVAIAESTKDSDLALDPRSLSDDPRVEAAMRSAGFELDPRVNQPGAWMSRDGIPVDLMVPEALAGGSSRRSAVHPPHDKRTMRRAAGLEAAMVDHGEMTIASLSADDPRRIPANVAGPAALIVAKVHKLGERQDHPSRLVNKDAHDLYRLLVAIPTAPLAESLAVLRETQLAGPVTRAAIGWMRDLFAAGPDALGSQMAARAEAGIGLPETVAQQCAVLAQDLLAALSE